MANETLKPVAWLDQEQGYAYVAQEVPKEWKDAGVIPLYAIPPGYALEPEWRLIETAPIDGTVFLGYREGKVREAYRVCRDDCEMWCFGGTSGAAEYFPSVKPTHWKPFPAPPSN